jgi:hypothetical protein
MMFSHQFQCLYERAIQTKLRNRGEQPVDVVCEQILGIDFAEFPGSRLERSSTTLLPSHLPILLLPYSNRKPRRVSDCPVSTERFVALCSWFAVAHRRKRIASLDFFPPMTHCACVRLIAAHCSENHDADLRIIRTS